MNQTHRVNIFFLKKVPGTWHDEVSADTGMSTNCHKSLVACKDWRAMRSGDRMTGGISLVSKFKVTNLVLVEDEKLTRWEINSWTYGFFYQSNWNCADSPRPFGIGTSILIWEFHCTTGIRCSGSEFTKQCSLNIRILPMITWMAV